MSGQTGVSVACYVETVFSPGGPGVLTQVTWCSVYRSVTKQVLVSSMFFCYLKKNTWSVNIFQSYVFSILNISALAPFSTTLWILFQNGGERKETRTCSLKPCENDSHLDASISKKHLRLGSSSNSPRGIFILLCNFAQVNMQNVIHATIFISN